MGFWLTWAHRPNYFHPQINVQNIDSSFSVLKENCLLPEINDGRILKVMREYDQYCQHHHRPIREHSLFPCLKWIDCLSFSRGLHEKK